MELTDQVFTLLMQRFDKLDAQNKELKELIKAHAEEDAKIHKIVERHSVYFSALLLGLPTALSYLAVKAGLKGQ